MWPIKTPFQAVTIETAARTILSAAIIETLSDPSELRIHKRCGIRRNDISLFHVCPSQILQ